MKFTIVTLTDVTGRTGSTVAARGDVADSGRAVVHWPKPWPRTVTHERGIEGVLAVELGRRDVLVWDTDVERCCVPSAGFYGAYLARHPKAGWVVGVPAGAPDPPLLLLLTPERDNSVAWLRPGEPVTRIGQRPTKGMEPAQVRDALVRASTLTVARRIDRDSECWGSVTVSAQDYRAALAGRCRLETIAAGFVPDEPEEAPVGQPRNDNRSHADRAMGQQGYASAAQRAQPQRQGGRHPRSHSGAS